MGNTLPMTQTSLPDVIPAGSTVAHIAIDWADPDRVPELHGQKLKLADPRVLRGAYDALNATPGVIGCDLVTSAGATGVPYYVVSVSDRPLEDPALESLRLSMSDLHGGFLSFRLVWAEGGGIKTAKVNLKLEVI